MRNRCYGINWLPKLGDLEGSTHPGWDCSPQPTKRVLMQAVCRRRGRGRIEDVLRVDWLCAQRNPLPALMRVPKAREAGVVLFVLVGLDPGIRIGKLILHLVRLARHVAGKRRWRA